MSELGRRYRREMVLRGFSPRTVESYERTLRGQPLTLAFVNPIALTKMEPPVLS
jgi:hypothetical protein